MRNPAAVNARLPLQPAEFHILVTLADGERHGYAILQDIEARTRGEVRLSAGTLYRTLQRLTEDGLIAEQTGRPPHAFDDERRRYYRATPFGIAVVRAELARLAILMRLAKAQGLTPAPADP